MNRRPLASLPFRHLLWSILVACLLPLTAVQAAEKAEPKVLKLLTWEEYISPDVLAEFTRRTGVKIQPYFFNSDGERDALLVGQDGAGYDVIVVNGLAIDSYRKRGWIQPLSTERVPNVANTDSKWRAAFVSSREYAAPLFWGTLGIAYRSDLVKAPITSWAQLLSPSAELCGRINMGGDARDVVASMLKAVGASLQSPTLDDYRKVENLLRAQKSCVHEYDFVSVSDDDPLVTGKIVAAMAYNGDAQRMRETAAGIRYVMPQEGGIVWADYLVIGASSRAPRHAAELINYLMADDNLLRLAVYSQYAAASSRVTQRLPKALRDNPDIVPSAQRLANFELDIDTDIRNTRERNRIFVAVSR